MMKSLYRILKPLFQRSFVPIEIEPHAYAEKTIIAFSVPFAEFAIRISAIENIKTYLDLPLDAFTGHA
jgi:hypothetical protein